MKISSLIGAVLLVSLSFGGRASAAEPAVPPRAVPAETLTGQQAQSLNEAWRNLNRAYLDLLSVSPDVKGDTSKLEGALKSTIHDLHQLDPRIPEAVGRQGQDRGQTRNQIFNAVQRHLDLGKQYIQGAKISGPDAQQALADVTAAYSELNADRAAPLKK
jgi:hypothetical protein